MKYMLQHAADSRIWDEVDEYVVSKAKCALTEEGQSRYSGNYIESDGQVFKIHLEMAHKTDLAIVARILGVDTNDCPPVMTGGFLRIIEFIKLVIGQRNVIHQINGDTFVANKTYNKT